LARNMSVVSLMKLIEHCFKESISLVSEISLLLIT
jgi:hypothetical protein